MKLSHSQRSDAPRPLSEWLPSKGNVLFTFLVAGFILVVQRASAFPDAPAETAAASASTVAYQGRLSASNGTTLEGTYSMVFKLYSADSGGSALWTETRTGPNAVQVDQGIFNVLLGSVTPIPQSIVVNNTSLWLGIAVNGDSEMTPRVQLGSAPYAMHALTVPDVSIATNKLMDAAVTSAKMDAVNAYSFISTAEATTSNIPTALATADTVAFTLQRPQLVTVFYGATASSTTGKAGYMMLSVDGGQALDDATLIETWGADYATIAGFHQVQLDAGPHTISALYTTQPGGTATFWRRKILVFSVSQ